MYDSFLREYKEKQVEILGQMQDHTDGDEQFYITANMTMNIAKRAKEIFVSSEVDEKRQFFGFCTRSPWSVSEARTLVVRIQFKIHSNFAQ